MTDDDLFRRIDAARVRAELTVQDLWLRYLALGGSSDAFDVDGFLQGLVTLDSLERTVLTQTVNEALADCYDCYSIPLPGQEARDGSAEDVLRRVVGQLLDGLPEPDTEDPRGI